MLELIATNLGWIALSAAYLGVIILVGAIIICIIADIIDSYKNFIIKCKCKDKNNGYE